jgi:hypothetical protein
VVQFVAHIPLLVGADLRHERVVTLSFGDALGRTRQLLVGLEGDVVGQEIVGTEVRQLLVLREGFAVEFGDGEGKIQPFVPREPVRERERGLAQR